MDEKNLEKQSFQKYKNINFDFMCNNEWKKFS